MGNENVLTYGVIDLVGRGLAETAQQRRHSGHYLGLSADLLEPDRLASTIRGPGPEFESRPNPA